MSLVSISGRRRSQRGETGMGKGEKGSFIIEGGRAWMSGKGGPPSYSCGGLVGSGGGHV